MTALMKKNWVYDDSLYVYKTLESEAILYNIDTSFYYTLEGIGDAVFKMLLEDLSFEAICDALERRYPKTGRKTLEKDARDFIRSLEKEGVIRSVRS